MSGQVVGLPASHAKTALWLERWEPTWKSDLVGKPTVAQAREKYKFGQRVDRGRFGTVYVSTGLGDKVAIKVIECKTDREVDWAASEMQIMMTVSGHHNVVKLIESFYSDGLFVQNNQVGWLQLERVFYTWSYSG